MRSSRKKINRKTQKGLIIINRTKGEELEKRMYKVTSPNGKEYILPSLRNFCIENNLNDSALQRVGKSELKQYKGWKCEYQTFLLN